MRPVLRVFISSTAVDLRDYREKVRDTVLGLEGLPITMETFSALSGQPASECMRMASEADALVCIVAHRYGYVPPMELGGDGERSITWLEVDAAKRAGKPVFAFLVDPKAPWTAVKEQDRLTSEPPENIPEIVRAVQKLQEFKNYLARECTLGTFSSDEELAKLVALAIAKFVPQAGRGFAARIWQPLFCHALQPAQHFYGRKVEIQELKEWLASPVTADRGLSVVAPGGTGKTALVEKALHQTALSGMAGVFVWSFYEDPDADAFLRAAYVYFTGEKDPPAASMLERLQLTLSGNAPHVMVLDGLERVQSEGGRRRRGELEEVQLKRLLRALAGGVGNARALATSRFPLLDLEGWTGAGYRTIVLEDLEPVVALEVLRAWKVKGDDAVLARLLEPLAASGSYHALSVAVLGSYLANFTGGEPIRAPEFSLEEAKASDDPKARRLSRILEHYAQALAPEERELLARLSLFSRGVKAEFLGRIVRSSAGESRDPVGIPDQQLVQHLARLMAFGLVFRYQVDGQFVYSAHPFLRDFFRNLLGTKPESDRKAQRLSQVLEEYAKALTPTERERMRSNYEELANLVAVALERVETTPRRRLQVFLCHSSGDKPAVRELYARLRLDGFSPWLDEEDLLPGQDWKEGIANAVRTSDVVVVCLSLGSVAKTGVVQWEIRFALDVADEKPPGMIFIIPARLEKLAVPDRLSRLQWVNLFEGRGYEKLTLALKIREGSLG